MQESDTSPIDQPLAINGGPKVRDAEPTRRLLFGEREKAAAVGLLDRAMTEGHGALGYNGPEEDSYCKEFADFMGGGFADGVNSGTNAVYLALRALELEPFSEVIVPAVSDPGGVMPVPLCNCIPVPVDCAPGSYNTGAEQIEAALTDRTRAILIAHIAGLPADMDPIMELARARGIPVIEDCAQAHGAVYKGRKVGRIGDIAAFSMMFGKHHATGGQGGIVYTQDEELYWRARRYADRGKRFGLDAQEGGNVVAALNCNMDELHAAIGRVQLQRLPDMIAARRKIAAIVRDGCAAHLKAVRPIRETPDSAGVYWFLLLHLDTAAIARPKEDFVAAVNAEGVFAAPHYRHVPAEMEWYANRRAFGRDSAMPWDVDGKRVGRHVNAHFPNFDATDAAHFRMGIHECTSEEEARDIVTALRKVEKAYLEDAR